MSGVEKWPEVDLLGRGMDRVMDFLKDYLLEEWNELIICLRFSPLASILYTLGEFFFFYTMMSVNDLLGVGMASFFVLRMPFRFLFTWLTIGKTIYNVAMVSGLLLLTCAFGIQLLTDEISVASSWISRFTFLLLVVNGYVAHILALRFRGVEIQMRMYQDLQLVWADENGDPLTSVNIQMAPVDCQKFLTCLKLLGVYQMVTTSIFSSSITKWSVFILLGNLMALGSTGLALFGTKVKDEVHLLKASLGYLFSIILVHIGLIAFVLQVIYSGACKEECLSNFFAAITAQIFVIGGNCLGLFCAGILGVMLKQRKLVPQHRTALRLLSSDHNYDNENFPVHVPLRDIPV